MPRAPLIIAAASIASLLGWAAHLALDPAPFASGPAAVLAVSLAAGAVVLGSALLLSRARWARPMVIGACAAGVSLAAVTPLDPGTVVAVVLSGFALAASLGPWLDSWLRRLPSAESPPRSAALALAATAALPSVIASTRFEGMSTADWVMAATASAAAVGLLRAAATGLWLARLAVPATGIAAGIAAGLPAGPILAAAAIGAALPSWHRDTARSIRPILPSPGNVAIPPELADPGLLEAAGFDDRGRSTGTVS